MRKKYDSPEFDFVAILFETVCSNIDNVSDPEVPTDDEFSEIEF